MIVTTTSEVRAGSARKMTGRKNTMRSAGTSESMSGVLRRALSALSAERPIFHSEADFQQALAWSVRTILPDARVRLETRPEPGLHLDLLVTDVESGASIAVELKYLTAAWTGSVGGEHYQLRDQRALDNRSYDVVKDLSRVERFTDGVPSRSGAVIVLANDPSYWKLPTHDRATNAAAFRLYEGNLLDGERAWGPLTGTGSSKGRSASIPLRGRYECKWEDYAQLDDGARGTVRYLWFDVEDGDGPAR